MTNLIGQKAGAVVFVIALCLAWQGACVWFGISDIVLPRPSLVVATLIDKGPFIWPHAMQTFVTTIVGFAAGVAVGLLIGVVIGWSKLLYDVTYPILVGFSSVPKVALLPILVLWFGAGTIPAVLTAMSMSIFPVVVNVATGLATTEPELREIMHVLKASRLDILRHVSLPRSMPYFFASLKVAITLAFVGSVVSETVASNKGIGTMMMVASSNFDVALTFAGLVILAAMGIFLYAIFAVVEARVTGWAQRSAH